MSPPTPPPSPPPLQPETTTTATTTTTTNNNDNNKFEKKNKYFELITIKINRPKIGRGWRSIHRNTNCESTREKAVILEFNEDFA